MKGIRLDEHQDTDLRLINGGNYKISELNHV